MTNDHVLVVEDANTWHVEHPERCHGDVLGCSVTSSISNAASFAQVFGDPELETMPEGRYVITQDDKGSVTLEPVSA